MILDLWLIKNHHKEDLLICSTPDQTFMMPLGISGFFSVIHSSFSSVSSVFWCPEIIHEFSTIGHVPFFLLLCLLCLFCPFKFGPAGHRKCPVVTELAAIGSFISVLFQGYCFIVCWSRLFENAAISAQLLVLLENYIAFNFGSCFSCFPC